MRRGLIVVVWLLTAAAANTAGAGQQPASDTASPAWPDQSGATAAPGEHPPAAGAELLHEGSHRLGPHDVVAVSILQAPELNSSVRVSEQGDVSLPLLGLVRASGLSTLELEAAIEERLRAKYIRDPHVTVRLAELHSQPVSLMGAVKRPGIYQLQGAGTLLEALALAGGLADDAGDTAMVQRRAAGAAVVEVDLKALLASRDPSLNLAVHPGDVIAVQGAAVVYVVGAVTKPGSFYVRGNDRLTVLRALALGGGATSMAAMHDAVVLRGADTGQRVEIAVDLDAILKGRTPDLPLDTQDVLFVPTSGAKVAARATVDTLMRLFTFRVFP